MKIKNIKLKTILFFLFPIFLVFIGKILILNGFSHLVSNYEDEKIKIIQSFLYFLGLGIFFFCGGFSDFISKRLFFNKRNENEKIKAYCVYTLAMFFFLNLISICGFIGFLICGNFAWLVTFSIINFLSLFSYFPTEKRFKHKIEMFS